MIGTWTTENSHNFNPGRNGHGSNSYSSTSYGINGNLISHRGTNSHGQHTSIVVSTIRNLHRFIITDIEQGPNFSISNPKPAEMRHGPSYQLVPNGGPTASVSHSTEATSNKPRRAYIEPMQRWVDEIAKEQPRNRCGIEEISLRQWFEHPRVFFQNVEDLVHELIVRLAVLLRAIWHKLRNQVFECGSLPFFLLE